MSGQVLLAIADWKQYDIELDNQYDDVSPSQKPYMPSLI